MRINAYGLVINDHIMGVIFTYWCVCCELSQWSIWRSWCYASKLHLILKINVLYVLTVHHNTNTRLLVRLTVYSDVNTVGLSHPGSSRNEVRDLAVELIIFVLLRHLHSQLAPNREQSAGFNCDAESYFHL